jgi:Glutaminase
MPTQEIRQRVNQRLEELYQRHLALHEDEIVGYYAPGSGYHKPEITKSKHKRFAICLATTEGEIFYAGDHNQPFALQSISKVFVYGMALETHGRDNVLERVGVETSGDAFNSIVFDERNNRPYNPMVNAGALATTDLVEGEDPAEDLERILGVLRRYAGDENLNKNSHRGPTLHLYRLREERFGGPTRQSRRLITDKRIVGFGYAQPGELRPSSPWQWRRSGCRRMHSWLGSQ